MWVLLVEAKPRTGGCLVSLNRRETRRARAAPTPSPPAEEAGRCLDLLNRRGTRRAQIAAPQTPLRYGFLVSSLARFALVLGLWIAGVGRAIARL